MESKNVNTFNILQTKQCIKPVTPNRAPANGLPGAYLHLSRASFPQTKELTWAFFHFTESADPRNRWLNSRRIHGLPFPNMLWLAPVPYGSHFVVFPIPCSKHSMAHRLNKIGKPWHKCTCRRHYMMSCGVKNGLLRDGIDILFLWFQLIHPVILSTFIIENGLCLE